MKKALCKRSHYQDSLHCGGGDFFRDWGGGGGGGGFIQPSISVIQETFAGAGEVFISGGGLSIGKQFFDFKILKIFWYFRIY